MESEHNGLFEDKEKRINQYVFNQVMLDNVIEELTQSRKLHKRFKDVVSGDLADEVEELFVKYFEGKELRNSLMHLKSRVITPKKRKWMKTLDKDLTSKAYHLAPLVDTDTDDTDELDEDKKIEHDLDKTKKRAIEWYENDESRLIDYPLFKLKSRTVQRNSILEDIACFIGNYFWADLDSRKAFEIPWVFANDSPPFDSSSRKETYEKVDENDSHAIYSKTVQATENLSYNYNISVKNHGDVKAEIIETKNLDRLDRIIIGSALSHGGEDFITKREFYIPIIDIVQDVYRSKSAKAYKLVEERLLKIQSYNVTKHITKAGEPVKTQAYGFFDNVEINHEENTANIVVNKYLHQQYVTRQVFQIYKEELDLLDPRTQNLLFYLQKERFLLNKTKSGRDEFIPYSYMNISSNVNFDVKRKSLRLKQIKESLEMLKKNKIVVQDYEFISNNAFLIKFIPLGPAEVQDFASSVTLESTRKILPDTKKEPLQLDDNPDTDSS